MNFEGGFGQRVLDAAWYAQVQAVFREILDLPEQNRRPYLERVCGEDNVLLATVAGMLEEEERGECFLYKADLARLAGQLVGLTDINPVQEFGPYRLIKPLDEGGMGVVYLAEREDLGKPVAIKFLRDAWLSPARRERFLTEQRLLASLNHPSIAQLYDAGTLENGTPWFAMEYVEGSSLTDHCRVFRCNLEEKLHLFRLVCEAVQYAHEHMVIHRDLKPSNILVRPDGHVRLLDFGIARQMDDRQAAVDQTRTALRLMSVPYAAPEQIRGEPVGVFTDVYALGVILYELLAGRYPFDFSGRTPSEVERIIVEGEPKKPSIAAPTTAVMANKAEWADLDVLCLTACHKDPSRRYRHVQGLIRDLDHFLNNEPLEARPDKLEYRARKFIRRNRRPLLAAAFVAVAFAAMAVIFAVRLASARDAALAAAARTQRVQSFIVNLFEGNDKSAGPAESLRVITLVDQWFKETQSLQNDPDMRAALDRTLGGIYQKLGNLPRADQLLTDALEERTGRLGRKHSDVAENLVALGLLRVDQVRLDEAERLIREGLETFKEVRPTNERALAKATAALGTVLTARGSYDRAAPILEEAVRLESRAAPESPELISILQQLAITHYNAGNYDVCEALNERTLAMSRRIFGDGHPLVADSLTNLGAVQHERGHFERAERNSRQALDIIKSWYGKNHPETASALFLLSKPLTRQKQYGEAVQLLKQALSIQERAFGPEHPRVANILNQLGLIALALGQFSEAQHQFERVIIIYKKTYGERSDLVALALGNLAGVFLARKEYNRAEETYREVLSRYVQTLSRDHPDLGLTQVRLGRTLLRQGNYSEAEKYVLSGYQLLINHRDLAKSANETRKILVELYTALKRPDQADRYRENIQSNKD